MLDSSLIFVAKSATKSGCFFLQAQMGSPSCEMSHQDPKNCDRKSWILQVEAVQMKSFCSLFVSLVGFLARLTTQKMWKG